MWGALNVFGIAPYKYFDWLIDFKVIEVVVFKVVFCLQTVSTIKTREWYIFNPTPCTSEKNQHFYCFSNNLFIVQPKIKGIKEPQRTRYTLGMTSFLFNEYIILDRHSHSSKTFWNILFYFEKSITRMQHKNAQMQKQSTWHGL